jgi:uncharacterized protein (DUF2141 family)
MSYFNGAGLTACLLVAPGLAIASEATSDLTIRINAIETIDGQILSALFETADGFDSETPVKTQSIQVDGTSVTLTYEGLTPGMYAFKLFQDLDGDGRLSTNELGIPSEPYGFSNNASDPFSAPEWDEARFDVSAESKTVQEIELN